MAVIYFTNNADSGDGSLRWAIAQAQPGDVVRPDESVFERGSTIEIVLASRFTISKNIMLDASPFRVILDGGSAVGCVYTTNNATAEFTSFDFVRGKSESGAGAYLAGHSSAVFNRCLFAGCDATYGGAVNVGAGSSATLNDCAVVGCRGVESGGGVLSAGALVLSGVTAAGCVSGRTSDVSIYSNGVLTARNSILGVVVKSSITPPTFESCVIDVASSEVGFVASPPDDLTVDNWNANAWQNWDLRLLDDASGAPSPYRDSGDVGAMTRYDLEGNFRGRETNDVATCSPGAYETIQADLFWVGRDATGAEVVSPSFLTSDGWAASRFATVAGDVEPSNASSLFVGANVAFIDVIATSNVDVAIGGERRVEILPKSTMRIGALTIGANANIEKPTTHNLSASDGFRFGINVAVEAKIQVPNYNATNWSDVNTTVLILDSYSLTPPEPYYTTLRVGRTTSGRIFLCGAYECETFETNENAPGSRYATNVEPGTSIRCRTFNYIVYDTGKGFTSQVVVKLYGEATANEIRSDGATLDASDDFVLDVTEATSATLTLSGQTVYGNAPTCAVALTGTARIDERGLTSQSLTLNADAALNVDGGKIFTETLDVSNGVNVEFFNGNNDAILSVADSATIGAASFTGTGYFATLYEIDSTAATFAETVRTCDYGANIQSFSATAVSASDVKLEWTQTDNVRHILIERRDDNGWNIVSDVIANESPYEISLDGRQQFRVFDGDKFLYDDAYFAVKSFYVYSISSTQKDVESLALYSKKTQIIRANMEGTRNENILLLAQIKNLLTGEFLSASNVDNVTASVYKINKSISSSDIWEEQDDWTRIEVDKETILEEPIMIDGWTNDNIGANFIWTPDTRNKSLFKEGGRYVIQVSFNLVNDNPIVISFNVNVK